MASNTQIASSDGDPPIRKIKRQDILEKRLHVGVAKWEDSLGP